LVLKFYYCKLANTKLHIDQGKKQYEVELWEDEKGMETILSPKIKQYRIQREMKKMDTQIQTPTKQK
jgi:hypothetical protein